MTTGRALAVLAVLGALTLPRAVAPAEAGRISGVDVSKYQHDDGRAIDWRAVKASGQSFAFIKATGGSNRVDPWFAREWAAAKAAGMIRGAYHYAEPQGSALAQAKLVVDTVGSTREANNLGIVLDLESTGGLNPTQLRAWARTFLREVERRTGRTPILYTYVSFWKNAMAGDRSFGAYPLWLARYGPEPAALPGWSQWTFWQYTSSGRVPGIVGDVDRNWVCCSAGTLAALADGRSRQIAALWRRMGGASGALGLPLGPEVPVPGGWGQSFQRGYVATTRTSGTHAVIGGVWERYRLAGAASGALGVPLGPERVVGTVAGQKVNEQLFAGGRIVHTSRTGGHALRGPVLDRWVREGGLRSGLGLPVGEQVGAGQQFDGGGLYVTPSGVRLVPGLIRDRYEQLGGPSSALGLPTSDPQELGELGLVVTFERGQLTQLRIGEQDVVL